MAQGARTRGKSFPIRCRVPETEGRTLPVNGDGFTVLLLLVTMVEGRSPSSSSSELACWRLGEEWFVLRASKQPSVLLLLLSSLLIHLFILETVPDTLIDLRIRTEVCIPRDELVHGILLPLLEMLRLRDACPEDTSHEGLTFEGVGQEPLRWTGRVGGDGFLLHSLPGRVRRELTREVWVVQDGSSVPGNRRVAAVMMMMMVRTMIEVWSAEHTSDECSTAPSSERIRFQRGEK